MQNCAKIEMVDTTKSNSPQTYKLWRPAVILNQSPLDNSSGTIDESVAELKSPKVHRASEVIVSDCEDSEVEEEMNRNYNGASSTNNRKLSDEEFMKEIDEITETIAQVEERERRMSPVELHIARQIQFSMTGDSEAINAISADLQSVSSHSPSSEDSMSSPPPASYEVPNVISNMHVVPQQQQQQIVQTPINHVQMGPGSSSSTSSNNSGWNQNSSTYIQLEPRQHQQQQLQRQQQQQLQHTQMVHQQQLQLQQQQQQQRQILAQQEYYYQMQAQQYLQRGYVYNHNTQQFVPPAAPMPSNLPPQPQHQTTSMTQQYPQFNNFGSTQQYPTAVPVPPLQQTPMQQRMQGGICIPGPSSRPLDPPRQDNRRRQPKQNTDVPQKRSRTAYTSPQLMTLEREFAIQKYVCRTKRTTIADDLHLSERQVKIWFQNRRMKDKKEQAKRNAIQNGESEASSSGVSSASSSPVSSSSSPKSDSNASKAKSSNAKQENQSIVNRLLSHSPQNHLRALANQQPSTSSVSVVSSSTNISQGYGYNSGITYAANDNNASNISSYYASFQPEGTSAGSSVWNGQGQGQAASGAANNNKNDKEAAAKNQNQQNGEAQDINSINPTIGPSWLFED